ncbi:unnamed protein product [Musa acuminata var. zebrina]
MKRSAEVVVVGGTKMDWFMLVPLKLNIDLRCKISALYLDRCLL